MQPSMSRQGKPDSVTYSQAPRIQEKSSYGPVDCGGCSRVCFWPDVDFWSATCAGAETSFSVLVRGIYFPLLLSHSEFWITQDSVPTQKPCETFGITACFAAEHTSYFCM